MYHLFIYSNLLYKLIYNQGKKEKLRALRNIGFEEDKWGNQER